MRSGCSPLRRVVTGGGRAPWLGGCAFAYAERRWDTAPDVDVTAPCLPFGAAAAAPPSCAYLLEESLQRISSGYRHDLYAYCLLSASAILGESCERGILARNVDGTRFFVHPVALLRSPAMFSEFFGESRSAAFAGLLRQLLATYDANSSSVVRACCAHNVDAERWIPFLRGLCMCVAAADPAVAQAAHVIEDSILGGGATHGVLTVPGDYHDRGISVANLLMEAGVEFGLIGVSQFALSLYPQFLPETPLAATKRLAVCFTRSERRHLDWNLRCTPGKRNRR